MRETANNSSFQNGKENILSEFDEKSEKNAQNGEDFKESNFNTKIKDISDFKKEELIEYANRHPIAIPTETVYGLAAPATNRRVIDKIFEVKRRPKNNPLILHVVDPNFDDYLSYPVCHCGKCNIQDIVEYFSNTGKRAEIEKKLSDCVYIKNPKSLLHAVGGIINKNLMEKFWPGPLTLLFPRGSKDKMGVFAKEKNANDSILENEEFIAIRSPLHPVARKFIEIVGPVFAPSANLSGKVSTTRQEHVETDLNGRVEIIIKETANYALFGLESTIYSAYSNKILRPGSISREQIDEVVGPLLKNTQFNFDTRPAPIVPGTKHKHYVPTCPFLLCEVNEIVEKISQSGNFQNENSQNANSEENSKTKPQVFGVVVTDDVLKEKIENSQIFCVSFQDANYSEIVRQMKSENKNVVILYDIGRTIKCQQSQIFSALRSLEKDCDQIFMLKVADEAIADRIKRASGHVDV